MSIVKLGSLALNIVVPLCFFYYQLLVKQPQLNKDSNSNFIWNLAISSLILLSPIFHILTFMNPSYCYKGHCPAPHHYKESQSIKLYQIKQNVRINQNIIQRQNPSKNLYKNQSTNRLQLETEQSKLDGYTDHRGYNRQIQLNDEVKPTEDQNGREAEQQHKVKTETRVDQFTSLPFFPSRQSRKSLSITANNQSPHRRSSRKSLTHTASPHPNDSPTRENLQSFEPLLKASQPDHFEQIGLQLLKKPTLSHSSSQNSPSIQCQLCQQCHIPKYLRMRHCYRCQQCVHKYDHHCVLLNICIGESNQKYYIAFLYAHLYNTIALLVQLLIQIKLNLHLDQQTGIQHVNHAYTIKAIVIIILVLNLILVVYLVAIHTGFIINGKTTYQRERWDTINYVRYMREQDRGGKGRYWMSKGDGQTVFPFDYGCVRNFESVLKARNYQPIDWKLPQAQNIRQIPLRQLKSIVKRCSNNKKYPTEKSKCQNKIRHSSQNIYHSASEQPGQTTTKSRDSYTMKSKQDQIPKVTWKV